MSKARLIITAVVLEGRPQAQVARDYSVSKGWVSKLVARYRLKGDAAFEPRSRRPLNSPRATPTATVELILELRHQLAREGHDAGCDTIAWHLRAAVAAHGVPFSTLTDNGLVFTTRFAHGGRTSRNALETELVRLRVRQKNSRPNHPTTCGKVNASNRP